MRAQASCLPGLLLASSLAAFAPLAACTPASTPSGDDDGAGGRSSGSGSGGRNASGSGGTSAGAGGSGNGGASGGGGSQAGAGGSGGGSGQSGSAPDAPSSETGSGAGGGGGQPSAGGQVKMIKLDTTAAGAAVMGDVPKYPVAIVLGAANFDFSQAQPKGEDIRFATVEGQSLPYAIESWDSTAKQAAIWVKVDVKGNSTQTLKMTWGDATAKSASDSNAVFDLKEGFTGVWHLNEPGSAAANTYKDATANAADGTGTEDMNAESTGEGRIGKGAFLIHAKDQSIQISLEKSKLYDQPDKMTYSIWANAKTHTVNYQCHLSKGEGGFRLHYLGTTNTVETCAESGSGLNDLCPVNNNGIKVVPGQWFHLVGIHDHPKHSIWVNGVKQAELTQKGTFKSDPTKPVSIGNNSTYLGRKGGSSRSFDGTLDEARLMNVAKDEHWIKLEYESQRDGQKFITFDAK